MKDDFDITTTLRRRVLSVDTARRLHTIKKQVLGNKYQLSLVLIGDDRSRTLNHRYRKKHKPTNILSFPLSTTDGEIFINIHQAGREAKVKNVSEIQHVCYLFIHGVLHLKGMEHGATMDTEEKKLLARFVS